MKAIYLVFFSILSLGANAQYTTYQLEFNNTVAVVSNSGIYASNLNMGTPGYEFPKGSGLHTMYAMAFWYGALDVNGQLLLSGQRYDPNTDIFAGPYSITNSYSNPAYYNLYGNDIWHVTSSVVQAHIEEFALNGTVSNPDPSILSWPGNGDAALGVASDLAPYFDRNNDGIYDPYAGDYPLIKGCDAVYVIMNDAAAPHTSTGGSPLNIEVHAMFYQYATNDYLNNTTFVELRVINRGTTQLNDFRVTAYADMDIGGPIDDYIGSDSTRSMVYAYNGDAVDELGYNNNPPAFGIKVLNDDAINTRYYTAASPNSQNDPGTAPQYWNYMQGKWKFGEEHYYGLTGYPGTTGITNIATAFSFPSNPNETNCSPLPFCWSEASSNNPPGDRRGLVTVKSDDLQPGQETTVEFALLSANSTNSALGNVNQLMAIADSVQTDYNNGISICSNEFTSITPLEVGSFEVYPNPANDGKFTVKCDQKGETKRLVISDALGQVVYNSQSIQDEISIHLDVPKGIYFISVEIQTGKIVKRIAIN